MRCACTVLLILLTATSLRCEEEVVEQWELWLREPLLLREAQVEELALLPWIDTGLAEAIVGLRQAGALQQLEDLLLIPGMDQERITAIAPFVRIEAPSRPARLRWESIGAVRQGRPSAVRSRLELETRGWWVGVQGSGRENGMPRAAASWTGAGLRLLVGNIGVRSAWPFIAGDPTLRSRTASPTLSRETQLRPRLSGFLPEYWGAGFELRRGAWRLVTALGRPEQSSLWDAFLELERSFRGELSPRLGVALRRSGEFGAWIAFAAEQLRGRLELALPLPSSSSVWIEQSPLRGSAAVEWRRAASRFGLAFTQSHREVDGQDPISGQVLDREHRSLQLHGGMRRGGWSLSGLMRRLRRGHAGDLEQFVRWQLEASGPWRPARLRLRLRMDEAEDGPGLWRLAVDWREAARGSAWGHGLALRRIIAGGSSSLLLALHLERGRVWFGRATLAAARGHGSSLWAVGLPTVGLSSTWLSSGELGLLFALGHRSVGFNGCLWVRAELGEPIEPVWAGGVGVRAVWGGSR